MSAGSDDDDDDVLMAQSMWRALSAAIAKSFVLALQQLIGCPFDRQSWYE